MALQFSTLLLLVLVSAISFAAKPQPASSSYNLVLVFIDFKDGRRPDGSLPTNDADLQYFNDTTINAVGGMGYVNVNPDDPHDPRSPKRRMIRKYTYDDYWDMYFTEGTYRGKVHPDYASHGILVYGSLRDYYNEATYGIVQIRPYQTWPGGADKYHAGVVNRIDEAGGKKYIRWIKISDTKKSTDYTYPSPLVLDDARSAVRALHALPKDDPEYIPFDLDSYLRASQNNKVIFIGAGGGKSGYARSLRAQDIWLTEKPGAYFRSNAFPVSALNGIRGCVHEIAHLLGVEHFLGGTDDPMSLGGTGPESTYTIFDCCPAHFNPWVKLTMGWIPPDSIIRVTGSRSVTLPPITRSPVVALITLYGDAGRGGDYSHSEYFLVEYRPREGFNRFAGGVSSPGFDGGALIWHFTGYHPFAVSGPILENRLSLKIADFGMNLKTDPGSPSHFFWTGHPLLSPTTQPSSNSAAGHGTGITLSGFVVRKGKIHFKVTYAKGAIPRWDGFYPRGAHLPQELKGKVYAEAMGSSLPSLNLQRCDVYLSPRSSLVTVLTARNSTLHLLEDATCTLNGINVLQGNFRLFGSGTFSVSSGASLRIENGARFLAAPESSVGFDAGMHLFLSAGAVMQVQGKLTAPDSLARIIKKGGRAR